MLRQNFISRWSRVIRVANSVSCSNYRNAGSLTSRMNRNFSDSKSMNPLVRELFEVTSHGTTQELKQLILKGVDVNVRGENGRTPLMIAAEENHLDILNMLIQHEAALNLQDDFGDTATMIAARENNKTAVRMLVEAGAQVDCKNNEEMTAAQITMNDEIESNLRHNEGVEVPTGPSTGMQ